MFLHLLWTVSFLMMANEYLYLFKIVWMGEFSLLKSLCYVYFIQILMVTCILGILWVWSSVPLCSCILFFACYFVIVTWAFNALLFCWCSPELFIGIKGNSWEVEIILFSSEWLSNVPFGRSCFYYLLPRSHFTLLLNASSPCLVFHLLFLKYIYIYI